MKMFFLLLSNSNNLILAILEKMKADPFLFSLWESCKKVELELLTSTTAEKKVRGNPTGEKTRLYGLDLETSINQMV